MGSSMAPLFHSWLHTLLQEALASALGWGAQRSHPWGRHREQQQRCLLGRLAGRAPDLDLEDLSETRPAFPVASRSREEAKLLSVWKLPL